MIVSPPQWSCLTSVSCPNNHFSLMDDSLRGLTAVQFLDLHNNSFTKVANLDLCTNLRVLDLSFNKLRSAAAIGAVHAIITSKK